MTRFLSCHRTVPETGVSIFTQLYPDGRPLNCRGDLSVVAYETDRPIGCILGTQMEADGVLVAFVERVMVLPASRGIATVRALWQAWGAWSRAHGCSVAGTALTADDSPQLRRVLQRGFHAVPVGTVNHRDWYLIPLP